MRVTLMRPLALCIAAAALVISLPAAAATVHFTAKLDSASETPPNDSKGAGNAAVSLDTAAKKISWKITYSGLTGPATMAHFHGPAPAGQAAGVAVPITPPLASPAHGSAGVTDAQIADLKAGQWYVNVHTAAHPGGEIRGQLTEHK
jgi:CHRD domain